MDNNLRAKMIKKLSADLLREKEVNKRLNETIAPTLAQLEKLVIENTRLRLALTGIVDIASRSVMEPDHGPK